MNIGEVAAVAGVSGGYDVHRGPADLYVADARFTAHYEAVAPGLARYVREGVHAKPTRGSCRAELRGA